MIPFFLFLILGHLAYLDHKTYRIAPSLLLLSFFLGLFMVPSENLPWHLAAGFMAYGVFFLLQKIVSSMKGVLALGHGDLKLAFVLCFILGMPSLPNFLMLSGSFGILSFWIMRRTPYPFAPALCLAFFFAYWLKIIL